ncbi:sterol desaturase family protein [Dyadobacter sandarakinus]|uniref:Sterol desaturase family protein n=1 Tax=Dyadobacter sandarakinus TaxID=2747268 RepID=A0ABX7I4F5_9BACT|nr:sterol desaturase family protein [Dyadobacter sandarakinus]QRR00969.1 sterol desaturase family protein [Dyadobacter sandarakinus]
METWIINTAIVLAAFVGMEVVAWLAHKYLMHGALWFLHHDHHQRDDGDFFEKNDYFFVLFAIPGILALLSGLRGGVNPLFWIGLGITLYGFTYFLVHDIFIHQRFKMFRKTESVYLKAIRRAHKMHHKHLGKHDGECFGMLWVPLKYFREARNNAAR